MAERNDYHHGDLKRALLDAALRHLREQPVEALSFRRLALDVGVSPGAPYHHFKDRADLLCTLAAEGFAALHATLEPVHLTHAPPPEHAANAADQLTLAFLRFAREHGGHYRVMFHATSLHGEHQQAHDIAHATFDLLVRSVQAFGVPADDAEFRAAAIWGLLHGLLELSLDGPLHERLPPEAFEPVACRGVRVLLKLD